MSSASFFMTFSDSDLQTCRLKGPVKIGGSPFFRNLKFSLCRGYRGYSSKGVVHATRSDGVQGSSASFSWCQMNVEHPYNFYTIRPTHNWRFPIWHVQILALAITLHNQVPVRWKELLSVQVSCRSTWGALLSIRLSVWDCERKVRQIYFHAPKISNS